ncbi:Substrate-binding region of ABC-type glycine betaine transport system [Kribbella flavida DSM 17836]|uniref:Substrate-binding region of ABC-type glycine betaine transport system n=1 Tax=Kribbella flavida (strain DSM 17836 / JCM 10339 / NBRC 14399) TaxID=479435 RepID=D2Q163_KRIFD|nr:ABC transporter substrate-binding protein [Kribbella flavida]ADB35764.1 Substrate-binding region of ABC-type glycine betaine transport system [Kribbella flavida DSM 17836]
MFRRTFIRSAIAATAVLALAACGGGEDPLSSGDGAGGGSAPDKVDSLTVGSANFAESQVLAEIYAQALEAKGIKVNRKLNIGARELYMAAIQDKSVDLLPEYTGATLVYFKKDATENEAEAVYKALPDALPDGLEVLNKSEAADEDAIVVTQETAKKYSLKSIGDLKAVSKDMVAGGGPEFKTRTAGLAGMKDKYGVEFKEFKTLDAGGPLSLKALKDNTIQVTQFFTTQSAIKDNNLVVLEDPEHIHLPNNIVPLIRTDHKSPEVADTLNAVQAKLTTSALTDLVKRAEGGSESAAAVAKDWLSQNPLT